MKRPSTRATSLVWLAIIAVAFFTGTKFQTEEPSRIGEADSTSPASADGKMGSKEEIGTKINPASSGGAATITRRSADPGKIAKRIGFILKDLERMESENARLGEYGEELRTLTRTVTAENARGIAEKLREEYLSRGEVKLVPVYVDFFTAWGAVAGADAMAYLEEIDQINFKSSVMAGWTKADPAAAKAYAAKVDREYFRTCGICSGVVSSLAETNLDDAIAFSLKYESGGTGSTGEDLPKKIFAQRGVAGLEAWFASIQNTLAPGDAPSYREDAAENGLRAMAEADPERTRKWLLEFASQGLIDARNMKEIVAKGKIATGPEDELSLFTIASPSDAEQESAYSGLLTDKFGAFLERDFDAAGAWLAKQPRDSRNDGAIRKFALEAARSDRETALLWVEQISDPRLREATLASPEFTGSPTVVRPR
jgi:hypothetical protein